MLASRAIPTIKYTSPHARPSSTTNPRPPDELAALYLRARDVPCPGCGYNRCDGISARCPECGHHLRLQPIARNPLALRPAACYWLSGVLIVEAAVLVPIQTYELVRMAQVTGLRLTDLWVIQSTAVNLGFAVGAVFAVLTILRVRRRHPRAARAASFGVGAVLAGFSVPVIAMLANLF